MAEHQTIAHYEILGSLGKGGSGAVYKAQDTVQNRTVAIRVLPPDFSRDDRRKKRLILDARTVSSLNHPNICTIYEVKESEIVFYMAMEYIEGKSILDEIHKGPMPEYRVLEYAIQIADALDKAHRKSMVHHNIKPSNLRLDEKDQIKILDFGLAQLSPLQGAPPVEEQTDSQNLSETGAMAAMVSYMPPEFISMQRADSRSDMFSLGVVLYEMLTGRPPFGGHTVFEIASAILEENPEPIRTFNTTVSAELERMVLKLLEKDPEKRFRSMRHFLVALRKHRREGRSQEIAERRPHRWSRSLLILGISLLLLMGLVGGLRILSERFPESKPAEEEPSARSSLIILPFKNKTENSDLDRVRLALTQMIIEELISSRHMRVLPYERMYELTDVIREMNDDSYGPGTLKKLSAYGDFQFLVRPAFLQFGNVWQVLLQFQNPATGETVEERKVIRESGDTGEKVLFDMLAEAAIEIKRQMNVPIDQLPTNLPAAPTEAAGEARIMYTEGVNHFNRGNYITAVTFLKSAVEKDPNRPLFYTRLAVAQRRLGYDDLAEENARTAVEKINDDVSVIHKNIIQAVHAEMRYDFDAAVLFYQKLINAYPDMAEGYFRLGSAYERMGFHHRALEQYDKAIEFDSHFVSAHLQKGKILARENQPGEAVEHLQEAMRLYTEFGNHEGRARTVSAIGTVHLNQNDFVQARKYFLQAQKIDQETENLPGLAEDSRNLGATYLLQGELKQAMPHIHQALREYRKIGDRQSLARVHIDLGNAYIYRGMTAQARDEFLIALEIARELQSRSLLADCNDRLAQVSYLRKEFEEARNLGTLALETYLKIRDRNGVLISRIELGDLEYEVGNYERAMEHYSQALFTSREIQDKKWTAFSLGMVGNLHYLRAEYQKALECRLQELQLFLEMRNTVYASYASFHAATCYMHLGFYDKALPFFEDSLRYFRENSNTGMAGLCLRNMGRLYDFRNLPGDQKLAEKAYQESLAIARELKNPGDALQAEGLLAMIRARTGERRKALEVLGRMQKFTSGGFTRHQILSGSHLLTAQLACELKRPDTCSKYAKMVVETAKPLFLRADLFQAYYLAGKAESEKGRISEAVQYFEKSIELIDEISRLIQPEYRSGFLARPDITMIYSETADGLDRLNRKEEADRVRTRLQSQTPR